MKRIVVAVIAFFVSVIVCASDVYHPTDLDRARQTTFALLSWKTALDAYYTDYGRYPDVKSLAEARAAVEPRYILQAPMFDSWGHPYRFEPDAKNGFRIISAGADGKFDPQSWSVAGKTSSLNDDAVVTGGSSDWLFRYWELRDKCSQ